MMIGNLAQFLIIVKIIKIKSMKTEENVLPVTDETQ